MRFWDSSAIVPLIVAESMSARMRALRRSDPVIAAWWASSIECASAIHREHRAARLADADLGTALRLLDHLRDEFHEVPPSATARLHARRVLSLHPLRAADALQLAAALTLVDAGVSDLEFVCLDERLATAARREGLSVIAG